MKILIDIGHPAHVHYFKNLIFELQKEGHEFLITARDKEVSHQLLDAYKIKYCSRGKGSDRLVGKLLYMLKADAFILKKAIRFKPDLLLSFASPYAAQVAWLINKPHIAVDDTEHAKTARKFYLPFSKKVITPAFFDLDLGDKHIKVKSFTELFYLHPKWFSSKSVDELLGINKTDKIVLFRFISWTANHDVGQSGISKELKRQLVNEAIEKGFKVFISSENNLLDDDLKKYKLTIPPEEMHSVLKRINVFVGESATMAAESALLGTPAIYINTLRVTNLMNLEEFGIVKCFKSNNGVFNYFQELLNSDKKYEKIKELIINKNLDFTSYLIKFINEKEY